MVYDAGSSPRLRGTHTSNCALLMYLRFSIANQDGHIGHKTGHPRGGAPTYACSILLLFRISQRVFSDTDYYSVIP